MALIEVFHVVASSIMIDADSTTDIPQGLLVTLDANYQVTPADGLNAATGAWAIGIAGDTRSRGTTSFFATASNFDIFLSFCIFSTWTVTCARLALAIWGTSTFR